MSADADVLARGRAAAERSTPAGGRVTSERAILAAQGAYFAATGLWPIFHMRSFEAITGPKVDRWLVKTVGLCIACIGGTLLAAARHDRVTPEIRGLAISSASALAAIDVYYSATGRISPIYLADAVAEAGLIAGFVREGRRAGRVPTPG
ncbi:hypothetical protein BH23ACI1_BH23ACI1_18540 [soil metagenome]